MIKNLNVLLIEDDHTVQYAMVEGLTDAGHVVSVAGTFNRAVEVLSNYHYFDVILLDLRLGDDRGEDIILRLRENSIEVPPVIVMSAQVKSEIDRAAEVVDAVASLQKPVSIQQVCDVMVQVITD